MKGIETMSKDLNKKKVLSAIWTIDGDGYDISGDQPVRIQGKVRSYVDAIAYLLGIELSKKVAHEIGYNCCRFCMQHGCTVDKKIVGSRSIMLTLTEI